MMESGEEVPKNLTKEASSSQEMPTTPAYPDWSSSMQAFYGSGGTPTFFPSALASPTPHPYIWGSQHPLMPPYGTPVPYQAINSAGGVFAHPSMSMTPPGTLHGTSELNGQATYVKENGSTKKIGSASKARELIGSRSKDGAKAMSGSGNDVSNQSVESGSENSSDESDDNEDKQDFPMNKKGSFDQMLTDGANAQNDAVQANLQTSIHGNSAVSVPATNLNIGRGSWNPSSTDSGGVINGTGVSPVGPGIVNDRWVRDERELKRQKRKQSNRESARRSRLRKQAECEELQHKVEMLSNENNGLREELLRLSEECEKITSENNSIKQELANLHGVDALAEIAS